jgi:hypothetical protein
VLTTELDDELIVYDTESKWAHGLNKTAACVWHHCDGRHTIRDLQLAVSSELRSSVGEETISLALEQLARAQLLMVGLQGGEPTVTRREMLRRARRIGAAAVAAPIVVSALVPAPAAAASPCVGLPCGPLGACLPPCTCSGGTCVQ